jgi:hypothetical protein
MAGHISLECAARLYGAADVSDVDIPVKLEPCRAACARDSK